MDKRRITYVLPYATNYEVNSAGQVANIKTGNELTLRDDNRIKLTNDRSEVIYIYPLRTYNELHYMYGGFGGTYQMGPEFPDYFMKIENFRPVIYNVGYPTQPISEDKYNNVRLLDSTGVRTRINIFKALAIYKLGQEDVGFVHIETHFHNFGYKGSDKHIEPVSQELSNMNVQILHPALRYAKVNLLKYYPGYCVVDNSNPLNVEIYECRTGKQLETTFDSTYGKRYKIVLHKLYIAGGAIGRDVEVGLFLEDFKLNPKDPDARDFLEEWRRWQ